MTKQQCKEQVWGDFSVRRCSRKAVKDGYCKQHHPDAVAARSKKVDEAYEAKRKKSSWAKLGRVKSQRDTLFEALENILKTVNDKKCLNKLTQIECFAIQATKGGRVV